MKPKVDYTRSPEGSAMPQNMQPVVLCGPLMLEIDALVRKLEELAPGLFTIANYHSTDQPPWHSPGYLLSFEQFNDRVANEEFAVHDALPWRSSGILKQTITTGTAAGRIVIIMEADMRMVRQLRTWRGWDARYVFVTPPSANVSEARWGEGNLEPGQVQVCEEMRRSMGALWRAPLVEGMARVERAEVAQAMAAPEFYDLILQSDDLDNALRSLVSFIWLAAE